MTETRIQTEKTPAGATNGATSLDRFREWLYPHRPVLVGSAALFAALAAFAGLHVGLAALGFCAVAGLSFLRGPSARSATARLAGRGGLSANEALSAQLSAVADALPNAVILLTPSGTVVSLNQAARKLTGPVEPGDHISRTLRTPAVLQALDQVLRSGETVSVSYFDRVPLNRWFQAHLAPLKAGPDRSGRVAFVFLLLEDLTEKQQVEKIRADFVANASHELRTPLASLLGFIETLKGNARNDPAAQERFLDIMLEQANRMSRLISDLMSLSRIEANAHVTPEDRVDLGNVISHVVDSLEPVSTQAGVKLNVTLPEDDDLIVRGDRDQLMQVVQNLIENAIKYGQTGKKVDISASRRPSASKAPGATDKIEFSVRDYGPGIPEEHLPRLTERFYRVDVTASRERGGTGLGLAIVKHILNRHRAQLLIESEPGEGAVFAVRFPGIAPADVPPVTAK